MRKKGQIGVEYLLALAVVIIVIIYMIRPGGDLNTELNSVVESQANNILRVSNRIFN